MEFESQRSSFLSSEFILDKHICVHRMRGGQSLGVTSVIGCLSPSFTCK